MDDDKKGVKRPKMPGGHSRKKIPPFVKETPGDTRPAGSADIEEEWSNANNHDKGSKKLQKNPDADIDMDDNPDVRLGTLVVPSAMNGEAATSESAKSASSRKQAGTKPKPQRRRAKNTLTPSACLPTPPRPMER